MKYIGIALIYIAFYALVGFLAWKISWWLAFLVIAAPNYKENSNRDKHNY